MCDDLNDEPHTCSLLLIQEGICSMYWEPYGSPDAALPSRDSGEPLQGKENGAQFKEKELSGKFKSSYRHVPHSARPAFQVARRNARERRRVQAVNAAFNRLHSAVPVEFQSRFAGEESFGPSAEGVRSAKRVSKVTTLRRAIEYIRLLQNVLDVGDDF